MPVLILLDDKQLNYQKLSSPDLMYIIIIIKLYNKSYPKGIQCIHFGRLYD
jgi:hypothetical protein